MLRRLIIGMGALGLVLVVYGLYRSQNPPPAKTNAPVPVLTMGPAASSQGATSEPRALGGIRNLALDAGTGFTFKVFDPHGQLQYLLEAQEWNPAGQNSDEVNVVQPSLSKFMRAGQMMKVTAKNGHIYAEATGKGGPKPKRGTLTGNVEILIDLTTRQWRADHPGHDTMETHPEHVIRIRMDSLYFDDDLSLIRSDGAVTVHSERFDVDSKGLRLIYGRQQDRLEHLEVLHGGTIELRGAMDLDSNPFLPSAANMQAQASATQAGAVKAATQPAVAEAPASQSNEPEAVLPAPERYVDIYKATFEGPVQVQQFRGDKTVARLDADQSLDLTFDMGPRERGPSDITGTEPKRSSDDTSRTDTAQDGLSQAGATHATIQWAGKLDMAATERRPLEKGGRTTIVHASGQHVVLADTDNTIECQDLQYDVVNRSGRIAAAAPALAKVADVRGRYLAGHDIRFDQSGEAGGTLEILGAGEAAEPTAGQALVTADPRSASSDTPTRIQWHKGLTLRFRRASAADAMMFSDPLLMAASGKTPTSFDMYQSVFQAPKPRPAKSLGVGTLKGMIAESANITGAALIQRGDESICSEDLRITFFPTVSEGQTFGPIQAAEGTGGVSLISKGGSILSDREERSITADQLDVQFERTSADASNPSRAIARGHAVIVQGTAKIEADHIDATLKPMETASTSSGLAESARGAGTAANDSGVAPGSGSRGHDSMVTNSVTMAPGTLAAPGEGKNMAANDAAMAPGLHAPAASGAGHAAKAKSSQKVAVSDLLADGNVRITDPKRSLKVAAGRLKASIDNGQTIRDVQVEGTGGEQASVATAEYKLTAPLITGQLNTEDVNVPSAGELTLMIRQDLQGQRLSSPQPLKITWTDHMRMYGDSNRAEFVGHVQAVQTNAASGRKELDFAGDRMRVDLRPAGDAQREEPASPSAGQQLTGLLDKAREQLAEAFPATEGWASPRKSQDHVQGPASREPIRITIEGNAKSELPRYDEKGKMLLRRLLMVGPMFVIDLERQQLEVKGKGNLLVENYAMAALANDPRASDPKAVIAEARRQPDAGLSQTVFSWKNSMLFILPEQEGVFDGEVNMIHLAGGKIRFGDELASALGAKLDLLKTMPGREATLNSDILCVQFSQAGDNRQNDLWMPRAKLENLTAEGNMAKGKMVSLEEQLSNGGTNFLTCTRLQYNGQRDTFVVQGSPRVPAQLVRQKDAQAIPTPTSADTFYWDRAHDRVEVRNLRGQAVQ